MTDRTIWNAASLAGWRKSTYSSPNADNCLEVLDHHPSGVPVRDSKRPEGPALLVAEPAWALFVAAVRGGALRS
ncbi:DUF397 domain-containing protein [Streptomyces sp. MUSC 14]|uniref:DUF397 domain-containing protein n=1 Tax=Streptomyces sp. MUSC 14 TaxID=1354889 RepID=UPI00091F220D|nr:DUF397 domain-containing protein [Streptomyces sp. MUSC 14]OIJ96744.1 DUF397 domain-containing protein [Streptomyces sp. MUSC 14]